MVVNVSKYINSCSTINQNGNKNFIIVRQMSTRVHDHRHHPTQIVALKATFWYSIINTVANIDICLLCLLLWRCWWQSCRGRESQRVVSLYACPTNALFDLCRLFNQQIYFFFKKTIKTLLSKNKNWIVPLTIQSPLYA